MNKFINQKFDINHVNETDLFICAFGYESRSMSLYKKITKKISQDNIYIFVFKDYLKYDYMSSEINNVIKKEKIRKEKVEYDSEFHIWECVEKFIKEKKEIYDKVTIHIDYSSMPRRWYYRLPFLIKNLLSAGDKLLFWYVLGKYPINYEAYPSAGIDSFSVVGKASLRTRMKRLHVVGLSYDAVRTSAMLSILDPDAYITCNVYAGEDMEINDNVCSVNAEIISGASMIISFQIDDFAFMISKLCEVVNEFLPLGDIILVPDGPKPLIFAMSLIPLLLNKPGITCLHVSRNKTCYTPVNVEPTDQIYGFSVE